MLRMRCGDGGGRHQTPGEGWEVDRGIDWSCRALGCPLRLSEHWLIHAGVGGNEC